MGSGKLPADGTNSPKRLYYIDILNILSCFAVVVLHCSGGVFYYQKTRLWFIYMFLQTVAHFAVPRVFYDNRCKFARLPQKIRYKDVL